MVEVLYFPNMNDAEGVAAYKTEVARLLGQGYSIASSIPLVSTTTQADFRTLTVVETILVTFSK